MSALGTVTSVLSGDLLRRPGAACATILAMAAGVSVFVAIHLASEAARSSFVSAVEAIAGRATHEVASDSGLPEERFAELFLGSEIRHAQPIIEGRALVLNRSRAGTSLAMEAPPLRILGIDPFLAPPFYASTTDRPFPLISAKDVNAFLTNPDTILLPQAWADEWGIRSGDRLDVAASGVRSELIVLGMYTLDTLGEAARDTAIMDLATAQEILGRTGRLDRVDLIIRTGAEEAVKARLAAGERLQRPAQRGLRVAKMVEAFRLNLMALGALALIVGALLIYNASQFSVVRRRNLLGQLRCLGVTRNQLLGAILLEASVLGMLGGLLGLALGVGLAQGLVKPIAETITNLYQFVRVDIARPTAGLGILVLIGTTALSSLAALFPAWEAAETSPRMVGLRSRQEVQFRTQLPRLLLFSSGFLVVGVVALVTPLASWWTGLVAAFAFLGAGATLLPVFMAFVLPRVQRLSERAGAIPLTLASGALFRSLTRAGGAASALGVALSMSVGVIVMVYSFEQEVQAWIESSIQSDIYISDAAAQLQRDQTRVPDEALALIRKVPGIRAMDTLRAIELPYGDGSVVFSGGEWTVPESRNRVEIMDGEPNEAHERLARGEVLVSEPFANRFGKRQGDFMDVTGKNGPHRFRIAGIFRDYSYDRGFVYSMKETFLEVFEDPGIRNVAVYVEKGRDVNEVAMEIRKRLAGRFYLNVRSNAELRTRILEVFDATFAVTYLLQIISTLIALAGISVTLFGLFLERAREIATLRALGSSVRYIAGLFATESLLMVCFPVLLAWPLGAVLAWILIHVVNLKSFGWTIGYRWPWGSVLLTCLWATMAAILASAVPWALARRQSIALSLRDE